MQLSMSGRAIIAAVAALGWGATWPVGLFAQAVTHDPEIPRTWDDIAVSSVEIPLAQPAYSTVHVPSEYYYRIPERTIYKSYPVYHPSRQPAGYIEWLRQQEPEIAFDRARLKTASDWTRAGETVFQAALLYNAWARPGDLQQQGWWDAVDPPLTREGILHISAVCDSNEGSN